MCFVVNWGHAEPRPPRRHADSHRPWPAWPRHDQRELANLTRVLESGNWGGFPSPNVMAGEFAEKFAAYHGATYGICTTGGTTALEVALKAAGLERGDEVLVPALTFYATAFAALVQGFKPVFVDVDPETWCIDAAQIERHITPDTRAILPVHLGSRMADMDRIGEIARARNLKVIEDCAHMHGGAWRGKGRGLAGRHRLLQLPVVEADDVRRGRHHHHERRLVRGALQRVRELRPRHRQRPSGGRGHDARLELSHHGVPGGGAAGAARAAAGTGRAATRTSRTSSVASLSSTASARCRTTTA